MSPRAGVCRFCGCSEFDACVVDDGLDVVGCSWVDRTSTLCSACAPAAKAEQLLLTASGITGVRALEAAYHAGFIVGWFNVHGSGRRNPYGRPADDGRAYCWDRGLIGGEAAGRQYRSACGPLRNALRREMLSAISRRPTRPGRRLARRRG